MTETAHGGHPDPHWFVPPDGGDFLAIVVLAIVLGGLYAIVYLYAAFDRWAEHQAQGTPLARTIPTLLAIALIYELFPVDHFHPLLPISAILIALMADWSRFHLKVNLGEPPSEQGQNPSAKGEHSGV
ncbi:MAG: hypothetical protein OIF40_07785 [Mangrovicoccus sp.]|nr:hypothetical protein [Mangrovicoccus sp.]